MARSRFTFIAVLSAFSLLLVAGASQAGGGSPFSSHSRCTTNQAGDEDILNMSTTVKRKNKRGRRKAFRGARVRTRLHDRSREDGMNNVVGPATDSATTNDNGVAKTQHEFNAFGNYEVDITVLVDGKVVLRDEVKFGVMDRESGRCDPPIPQ